MVRDNIAELINGIKNAHKAGIEKLVVPYSKLVFNVLGVLEKENYVTEFSKKGKKVIKFLEVKINKEKQVTDARRVSKLSKRVYKGAHELIVNSRVNGIYVLTTPKGVMTHREAKKQNVGGELLFRIW